MTHDGADLHHFLDGFLVDGTVEYDVHSERDGKRLPPPTFWLKPGLKGKRYGTDRGRRRLLNDILSGKMDVRDYYED